MQICPVQRELIDPPPPLWRSQDLLLNLLSIYLTSSYLVYDPNLQPVTLKKLKLNGSMKT